MPYIKTLYCILHESVLDCTRFEKIDVLFRNRTQYKRIKYDSNRLSKMEVYSRIILFFNTKYPDSLQNYKLIHILDSESLNYSDYSESADINLCDLYDSYE